MSFSSSFSYLKNNKKNIKDKINLIDQNKSLEIYPKNSQIQLKSLFRIKKLKSKFILQEKEKTYLFTHSQDIEQAKLIFEFFLEEKSYLTNCFVRPVAIAMVELTNYLNKRTKVYMVGEKKETFEEVFMSLLSREEKTRFLGSIVFNLAKMHENNIAIGDVSLSSIYRKKNDSTAIFSLPSQIRIIKKKEEGYDEFAILLNNFLLNKLISKKEIELYIDHYLKSFEKNEKDQNNEKGKQVLLKLFENYYEKYYYKN